MVNIKFGTDGWRAIIAKEYTVDNVVRVTYAAAKWMKEKNFSKVVIGYDCRFAGKMFSEFAANVFAENGITVYIDENFASTPMVSLGVVKMKADLGIVITASHNPPSYNGYKLKSHFGGPTIPKEVGEIESLIPDFVPELNNDFRFYSESDLINYVDLEQMYMDHVLAYFDMDSIKKGVVLAYDAMYGAGQNVIKRLFPKAYCLHCDYNPSFKGQAPEPIARNLKELSQLVKSNPDINLGLANDGDADRIGLYDEDGEFVDSHHILLLLLYYMYEFKHEKGKVAVSFSVSNKVEKLAKQYGLEFEVTKIGFKYIAEIMIHEDVLVGGEESGGISVKGHIPERDGVWMGLLIMELMAKTGKSLKELIQVIYEKVGPFKFDRDDLHLDEPTKQMILEKLKNGQITEIGGRPVIKTDTIDGWKFFLDEDTWVMARPSGTEPVFRVYCQAETKEKVRETLDAAHKALLGK
ncbi:MAG TPA: phosphoglucomutase/phosphomannomutase family protein [Bacteroidetes bacterium]|nr:phosphoglucomutase/phosphomannomutase family protein [Bacteroidota bacterium]